MTTFTSSLPEDLLQKLDRFSKKYGIAKNKILARALDVYLDQLNRAEYARSYQAAGQDKDTMLIAEEGMQEYLRNLDLDDQL